MICMGRQRHSWRDVKRCQQNHNPHPVLFFVTCQHHLEVKCTRFCRLKRYHMNVQVCFTCMTFSVFILWLRLVPNIAFCERRSWSPKWRWSPCRCVTDAWRDMAWCGMTWCRRRSSCLGSKHNRSSSRIAGSHGIKWDHCIASQDDEQLSWSKPT